MTETPKWCCRMQPDIFTDVKVGSTVRMWVVACCGCGKYSDAHTKEGAIFEWNMHFRKKNPVDTRFAGRLNAAKKKS